jgi:pantothenate kinase
MAGTIVANTLNTDTGVFSTNNAYLGIAKAWVSYNASTQTINNSFNVSSVTYVGTGSFTINFSTAMTTSTYAVLGSCGTATTNDYVFNGALAAAPTTSACNVGTYNIAGTQVNPAYVYVGILGS